MRTTSKEQLHPTSVQEQALDEVLWRCRSLYNTALEQRSTAWQRYHISVTRFQHEAELRDLRADVSEDAALHSPVVQEVLARLDTTEQGVFRRLANGGKPGFPPF